MQVFAIVDNGPQEDDADEEEQAEFVKVQEFLLFRL